jgi:CBS domain-containing protein
MPIDNEAAEPLLEEECPGPTELESAMADETLGEVVTAQPLTVSPDTTVAAAIGRMQQDHRGYTLVLRDGALAGIFTERDVLMRVAGRAVDPAKTPVTEVMTADPVTLPADASVAHALNLMVIEGFRHIPVMDDRGRPIAVVSMRNLIEYLSEFFRRDVLNLPPDPRVRSRAREGA